jgi:hypothetical protein
MFSTLEDFAKNQKEFMISSNNWTFSNNDISRFKFGMMHYLNDPNWANLYHNFNHLLKFGLLENEILVLSMEGWTGFTNYRFYYNFDSGLFSIPISSIIKYWDYKTSNLEEIESAKIFLKAKGINFRNEKFVYKTLDGGFEVFYGDGVLHEDHLKKLIHEGEYLNLSEEATKSIYKTRSTLRKKYSDLEKWSMEKFIQNLGDEKTHFNTNIEAIPRKVNGAKKEKSVIRILVILAVFATFLPWYNAIFGEGMGFKYFFIPIILLPLTYTFVSDEKRKDNPLYGLFLGYGISGFFLFCIFSLMMLIVGEMSEFEKGLAREGIFEEFDFGIGIGLYFELFLSIALTYFTFRLDAKN